MDTTMLADLINPEVMADMAMEEMLNRITFAPLAIVDRTLVGRAGDTVTLPKWGYIGDAEDVAEGADIPIAKLSTTKRKVQIKKAGKGVEVTDESVLSGHGDALGTASRQIGISVAQKIDNDMLFSLGTIGSTMTYAETTAISSNSVADALTLFGENIDEPKALIISPKQFSVLRKDPDYMNTSEIATQIMISGSVGMIWGCQLVVRNKIAPIDDKITNFIVKAQALALYLKREMLIETARNIKNKTTLITGDEHYATYLYDESKAIKMVMNAS